MTSHASGSWFVRSLGLVSGTKCSPSSLPAKVNRSISKGTLSLESGTGASADVEVQVRLGGVAGVAEASDDLAAGDLVADLHRRRAGEHVGIEGEVAVADVDDDVVPAEFLEGLVGGDDLRRRVLVVGHHRCDGAVGHGQQRGAVGDVVLVARSVAG